MQSEIFQAFICYNFHDYGLQLMKTFYSILILNLGIIVKIITNKGLKYLSLHVYKIHWFHFLS